MTLDEFTLGKAWLNQFPFIEQEVGRQLLRSLRLVSSTQFEMEVSCKVAELVNQRNNENFALFSVTEALSDEDDTDTPRRSPGSSADRVKHINENLARVFGPRVQANPTVHSMRAQRIKNIVLIEDFIGTGKRISTYLRDVMHPTLKSWISYKWTKLWIVCYGGLDSGIRKVIQNGYALDDNRVRLVTPAQRAGQFLSPLMKTFCKTYAARTRRPWIPLGFGDGAVGMIFEHGCPNNAPVVLWSKGKKFNPLFPERGIPPELKPAFSQEDLNRPAQILWESSQYRLAIAMLREPKLERHQDSQWRLLLMLGLASRSRWDDSKIASTLGIPVANVIEQRLVAYRLNMLDSQTHILTEFGRGLLERVRVSTSKKRAYTRKKLRTLTETYYPLSCAGSVRY